MTLSGFKKRSIAQQTGNVFFDFSASVPDASGSYSFGLSGGSRFEFTMSGGKLFDPDRNFVQSYFPNQALSVSGVVSPSSYNYYVNNSVVSWGQATPALLYSSPISYLYGSSASQFELEAFVKGESPDYTLDEAGSYSQSGQLVTGRIINNISGRAFRIFDASTNGQTSFTVHSFTTGDITGVGHIVFSGDGYYLQDQIVPTTLQTNFGQVDYQFLISGDYSQVPDVYLNLSPDLTVAFSDQPLYINAAVAAFPSGTRVGVSLEYVSGVTGNVYFYSGATGYSSSQLSGYITGCGTLSYSTTGLVSGLDPKTSIWETGAGTGLFSSATLCATGNVSGNYRVTTYGVGYGNITTDYTASGYTSGYYQGRVPFTGATLNAVAYNFAGTGESPTVATGVVPEGDGKVLVYPTGEISVGSPLSPDDYYQASISASKVFSGPLYYDYSVIGVGYATGQQVSGTVTSNFLLNFEPGRYTFSKYFSGVVSGYGVVSTGLFDLNLCPSQSGISGLITGNFSSSYFVNCDEAYPTIRVSGSPSQIYNLDGTLAQPNYVYAFSPSGGFDGETLERYNQGYDVKTRISRMGATSSGFGTFVAPLQDCAVANRSLYSSDITAHYWRETISGVTSTQTGFDSLDNGIGVVNTKLYITGTGDITQDMSGVVDSGVMDFYISGSGAKAIALKGLNLSQEDRILSLTLYKNGLLENSWEDVYVPGYLYDYYDEALGSSTPYDTVTLSELESGYYSLVVTAKTAQIPEVSFTTTEFSGCESSRNIVVSVQAQGVFRKPCCVDLKTYDEATAHSGVHYDPIYLEYGDTGLRDSGCVSVGAHAPRGSRCPGICFDKSYPNSFGTWQEEIKTYQFTIPIYDNAVYGDNASFYIYLDNPSGCSITSSTATITIVDNDNKLFITGDPTGMMTGATIDCSLVPDLPPEPPTGCIFDPLSCDPCYQNPASCISGHNPPCICGDVQVECLPCAGGSTEIVSGVCNGQPVSGLFGIPGASCGVASTSGCGPTNDYIYVGTIPMSGGALPRFEFSGRCLAYDALLLDSSCGMALFECRDNTGECPQTVTWSGCSVSRIEGEIIRVCSGIGDTGQLISFGRGQGVCNNYASGYFGRETLCGADLFVKISSVTPCDHTSHGCFNWLFTGRTVFPPGNPQKILCNALL